MASRFDTLLSRHLAGFALMGMIAVLTAGCAGANEPPAIWLGQVATLSGPDKHAGEAAARGLRLAVEEFDKNVEQGLGRPIKVIHSDARGKLDEFEAEAIRLAAVNHAYFLFGGGTADEVDRLSRAPSLVITPRGARSRTMDDAVYCTGFAPRSRAKRGRVCGRRTGRGERGPGLR